MNRLTFPGPVDQETRQCGLATSAVAAPDVAAMVRRLRKAATELDGLMVAGVSMDADLMRQAAALIEKLGSTEESLHKLEDHMNAERRCDFPEHAKRWIPVGERLPKNFEDVLARGKDGTVFNAWLQPEQGGVPVGWMLWTHFSIKGITHWMPLPPPPERP